MANIEDNMIRIHLLDMVRPLPPSPCPLPHSHCSSQFPISLDGNRYKALMLAKGSNEWQQKSGRLPRNLPALRAMEMALRTNSFATPTTANEGGGAQDMDEADDSDSEMEYMIPLHTASKRGMPRIFNSSQLRTFWQWAKFVTA
ncbi:hypothetical protein ACLKA6_004287 [Drosophila palustris]